MSQKKTLFVVDDNKNCYTDKTSNIPCEWKLCVKDSEINQYSKIPSECRYVQYNVNNEQKYGCFDMAQVRNLNNDTINRHLKLDEVNPLPEDFIKINDLQFGNEIEKINNKNNVTCRLRSYEDYSRDNNIYFILGNKNTLTDNYYTNTSYKCKQNGCVWK